MRVKFITDRTNTVAKTGIFVEIEDEIMKINFIKEKKKFICRYRKFNYFF